MKSWPCSVYRYFTSEGQLLYVGCTQNFPQRDRAHKSLKDWYPQAHYVVLTNFSELVFGQHYERAVVTQEKPLHNVHLRNRIEKMSGCFRDLERGKDGTYYRKPKVKKCTSF